MLIPCQTPRGRLALPEEIAAAVAFVAMDGASFMTGSSWGPDGEIGSTVLMEKGF